MDSGKIWGIRSWHVLGHPETVEPVERFRLQQASHVSLMNADAGVRYLQHQLDIQADAMRRKGIAEDVIQREFGASDPTKTRRNASFAQQFPARDPDSS
jgi:hypothetical protein